MLHYYCSKGWDSKWRRVFQWLIVGWRGAEHHEMEESSKILEEMLQINCFFLL
jgi:hypothetical protein